MAMFVDSRAGHRREARPHHLFAEDPGARVHLYGKRVRRGKIGHVTVLGDEDQVRAGQPGRALLADGELNDGG